MQRGPRSTSAMPCGRFRQGARRRGASTARRRRARPRRPAGGVALRDGDLVFPSPRHRRPLTALALGELPAGLAVDAVPHGFRSSFRDWAAEETETPHAVTEAAPAHALRNPAEAAYARSDLLDRRRRLMQAWADYLSGA